MDLSKILTVAPLAPPKKERMSLPVAAALLDDLVAGAMMVSVRVFFVFSSGVWTEAPHIVSHYTRCHASHDSYFDILFACSDV